MRKNQPGARARRLPVGVLLLGVLHAACASTPGIRLPAGQGTFLPQFQERFEAAVDQCRRVRSMELAIAINARTGGRRLRGDLLGALAHPASVRLVGVAPFGAPAFELVAERDAAVLVLPRDRQYVRASSGAVLLQALAGLPLGPADLQAVLTGCVVPSPQAVTGRIYPTGWVGMDLDGNARLFTRNLEGADVVVAGTRPGMQIEYFDHVRGLPRRLRILVHDADGVVTDLTARLSRVNINIELHPDVFVADIRDDYVSVTLDQFRRATRPLEAATGAPSSAAAAPSR